MTGPRAATLLHTADSHLECLDGDRRQLAFAAAVDTALRLDVDLVLVTGDLFDHGRVGDDVLDWTAAQLDRVARPVVLLSGIHDPVDETSVQHRLAGRVRAGTLHLVDRAVGQVVEVPGTDVVVWGRAMLEHHPSFRPLRGAPRRAAGRWLVVVGHGLVVGGAAPGRSSPIPAEDLDAVEADYVALGHVHVHRVVRTEPLTAYAGATASSLDGAAGCVVVDLVPGQRAGLRWVPLDGDPT